MSDERCERTVSKPSVFNLQQVFGTHKVKDLAMSMIVNLPAGQLRQQTSMRS
jgi:hypothetical protein